MAEKLVIAVNSDDYCRRTKGADRPVQPAVVRARVAKAIIGADVVTIFDEDTPNRLLSYLRPTVYVLGNDYEGREISGGIHCERVVFIPRIPGLSTTNSLCSRCRERKSNAVCDL